MGNEFALRLLIDKGVDVNTSTRAGEVKVRHGLVDAGRETLVWLAAAAGHLRVLDLLLAKGADIKKRVYPKECSKHTSEGCLFAGERVLGCTAVQIAVSHNHWDCVRLLVSHRGELNGWVHLFEGSPVKLLHLLISTPVQGDPAKKVQLLADMGADLDIENHTGRTPLHVLAFAASNRYVKVRMAQALVAMGAKVDYQDDRGFTPLHLGVMRQDYDFIEFLLKSGADPNAKETNGSTPLHFAAELRDRIIFRTLVKAGGKADMVDGTNRTARSRYDNYLEPSPAFRSLAWFDSKRRTASGTHDESAFPHR